MSNFQVENWDSGEDTGSQEHVGKYTPDEARQRHGPSGKDWTKRRAKSQPSEKACERKDAHDNEGIRIETIEFSLTENKIVQSRGVCNENAKYHEAL